MSAGLRTLKNAALHAAGANPVPFSVVHFVTNRCNLRCKHCFIYGDFDRDAPDPRYDGAELTIEETIALTQSFRGNLGMVSFTGGEPFLRDDFPAVAQAYVRHAGARLVAISSNGFYLRQTNAFVEEILRTTDAHLYFMLSFDGPRAIHDRNRGFDGGFDRTVAAARHLIGLAHPRVQVSATISVFDQATDEMLSLFRFLAEEVGLHGITTSAVRGKPVEAGSVGFNAECHRALNRAIRDWTRQRRIRPFEDFGTSDLLNARGMVSRGRVEQTLAEDRYIAPCTAGRVMVVIHANGLVYPCEMLDQPLGSLQAFGMDLQALLRSAQAREIRRAIVRDRCFCSYECAWSMNAVFEPRNWGRLMHEYIALKFGYV